MTRRQGFVTAVLAWGGAAYGVLWLGGQPGDLGHALFGDRLCGPWGCLPPLQALVALHAVWVLLLAPLAVWVGRYWPANRTRAAGALLALLGAAGVAALTVVEARTWLPTVSSADRLYLPHRVAYRLALLTDLPLVQVTVVGVALIVAARFRRPMPPAGRGQPITPESS
jgi:hypothetical protein